MKSDIPLKIIKILLSPPFEDETSVRNIAKKLGIPASHVFYYLKKMHKQGILIKEECDCGIGLYTPNDVFVDNIEATKMMLRKIAEGIEDSSEDKLANSIRMFLKIHGY